MINLTAIKRRLEGLSPEPWIVSIAGKGESKLLTVGDPDRPVCRLADVLTPWETRLANAMFIAEARHDIPALIAEIECIEIHAVHNFVERVNRQAEANMERTGRLEGAHYAAMQSELAKMEVDHA